MPLPAQPLALPLSLLAWLGRQGTRAVAISALLGLMLPQLSALFRPLVSEAIFVLLVLAFLRVDPIAVVAHMRRPRLILIAMVWMQVVVPLCVAGLLWLAGPLPPGTDIALIAFLVTAGPAVMSAPAFIALIGLDSALSLALVCICMMLVPFTAPLAGALMLGDTMPLETLSLGIRLALLLVASAGLAWLIRKVFGQPRIQAARQHIDGLNVLILFIFAVAVMDGVAARFVVEPLLTVGVALLTFVVALTQMGLTMLVFFRAPREQAFVLAHACGNRNMGLLVAALGGTLPDMAWLYFGLGQLPIYLLPWMLKPLATRLAAARDARDRGHIASGRLRAD